jgi:hypothetical protein
MILRAVDEHTGLDAFPHFVRQPLLAAHSRMIRSMIGPLVGVNGVSSESITATACSLG